MKRIILLMLACLLIGASLAGCGSGKTPDSGNTGIETPGSSDGGQTNTPDSLTTAPETDPPIDPNAVAEVILGQDACVMFTDQTAVLSVVAKNGNGAVLTDVKFQCSLADATVAQAVQSGDTVTVTPQKAGRTKLTVTADGGVSAEATVTVLQFYADSALKPFSDAPEYLSNIILYRRGMLENPGVSRANAEAYAKVLEQYADLFPQAQVSMLVAPKSSILYQDDPYLGAKLNDQTAIIDTIYDFCSDRIKTIPTAAPILEHSDDYLFFYSDHHWTSLGAYYAYASMARTLGWEPADISEYNEELRNTEYHGTLYSFSGKDARTKQICDSIYLYSLPNKTVSMTIYNKNGGQNTYSSCFMPGYKNYLANIGGDNPLTVITVKENDPSKIILVLKDSFGCCFVPFLTEHYGTIVVVDPREASFTIQDKLRDYNFSDIIFVTSIFNPSVSSWINNCKKLIGQ